MCFAGEIINVIPPVGTPSLGVAEVLTLISRLLTG